MPRGGHWGAEKSKKFGAQSLAETRVSNDQRWLELTFGERHMLSLPMSLATDLAPALLSLVKNSAAAGARLTKLPSAFSVGHATCQRLVLSSSTMIRPMQLKLDDARMLSRQLDESETATCRKRRRCNRGMGGGRQRCRRGCLAACRTSCQFRGAGCHLLPGALPCARAFAPLCPTAFYHGANTATTSQRSMPACRRAKGLRRCAPLPIVEFSSAKASICSPCGGVSAIARRFRWECSSAWRAITRSRRSCVMPVSRKWQ